MSEKIQAVRGMHDILPETEAAWFFVHDNFLKAARAAGYSYIKTPVLEDAALFMKKGGGSAELVDEEMYSFADRSGNLLAMRPEGTPTTVRAYIEHGMSQLPKPVKLFYHEPMFRYDRPQAGRYRQFFQYGVEVFGEDGPEMDANVIALLWRFVTSLGVKNISLQINSVGDEHCRPRYIKELVDYYNALKTKLCDKCVIRIKDNPLRLLDCKEKSCQPLKARAPHLVDYLDKECNEHFKSVLEYLDESGVEYVLNPYLVRGLDYYNRTAFELWQSGEQGAQAALAGGGRYDGLVELLGGRTTPAVGFAGGVERLLTLLQEEKLEIPSPRSTSVYIAQIGPKGAKACFKMQNQLLDADIQTEGCSEKESIQGQLKKASDLGVPYTLILGQKEVFDSSVIIRDMNTGGQEVYPQEKIVKELTKRLSKN